MATFKTFKKLKAAGLPKASLKFSKLDKAPSFKAVKIKDPKMPKSKTTPAFNLAKYSKLAKLPKAKKVTILKSKLKKYAGF